MNWIIENKEWILSGIGTTVITYMVTVFYNHTYGKNKEQVVYYVEDKKNVEIKKQRDYLLKREVTRFILWRKVRVFLIVAVFSFSIVFLIFPLIARKKKVVNLSEEEKYELIINELRDSVKRKIDVSEYHIAILYLDILKSYEEEEELYINEFLCYYYLEDYSRSLSALQRGIENYPDIVNYRYHYNNIGNIYLRLGKLDSAKIAFEEYSRREPYDSGLIHRNWGVYYFGKGMNERAIAEFRQAIDLGYWDLDWFKNDKYIGELRNRRDFRILIDSLKEMVLEQGVENR
ncbi:MAG: hypothetical protein AAFY76_01475 [Cyanobacteria bacterium J06649_11]